MKLIMNRKKDHNENIQIKYKSLCLLPLDLLRTIILYLSANEYILFRRTSKRINSISNIKLSFVHCGISPLKEYSNFKIENMYFYTYNFKDIENFKKMNINYEKLMLSITFFDFGEDLKCFSNIKNLTKLSLPDISSRQLEKLLDVIKNQNIKILKFSTHEKITEKINDYNNIKYLQLSYLYTSFIPDFSEIKDTSTIRISKLVFYKHESFNFKKYNKNIFENLKLNFIMCYSLTDDDIFDLIDFPIISLHLEGCSGITNTSLSYVSKMPHLKKLHLSCLVNIHNYELEILKNSPILDLELSMMNINDKILDFINFMNLQTLTLNSIGITKRLYDMLKFFAIEKKIKINLYFCDISNSLLQEINNNKNLFNINKVYPFNIFD